MSHMSRVEIEALATQFAALLEKIKKQHNTDFPLMTGLLSIEQRLKDCKASGAPPSVELRHCGRLLKHYLEEIVKRPNAVMEFNVAVSIVEQGKDPQTAIKDAKRGIRQSIVQMDPHLREAMGSDRYETA